MKKTTISHLQQWKQQGQKFCTITAYDASFAALFEEVGIPLLLIGDSLGMVLQGHRDTVPVSVDDMAYHTRCVRAGADKPLIVSDLPFMSYATPEQTYRNAALLMQAGANMIKLEGGTWLLESIKGLTERGIPVCGHLGLTPQSVHLFGGFKVQGRDPAQANALVAEAEAIEQAGAQLLVIECVPTDLAERITRALSIPVIGIGAGNVTDGQVLVMHDALGISAGITPKFSRNFLAEAGDIRTAIALYKSEVEAGRFPAAEHSFS